MSVNFLLVPVLLPFAVGVLILFIPRALKGVKEALTFIAMALVLAAAVRIATLDGLSFSFALFEMGTFSVAFDLNSSTLSSFVLILITGFGFLISLYSISYMAGKERLREYYAFMLFAVGGSSGVVLVDNLLLFLIFWEIVTASLYFLITTGQPEAKAGATKTFAMIGAADGLLLMGIGLVWYIARTLRISDISISTGSLAGTVAFILMMMGAITKAGSMPLHTWIPAASDGAPASVMALLPAALDKLLGIFLLLRVATGLFTPGEALSILLMALGAVTILSGVMMAMVQHDLRRLLSYHAISQVGYMVLGIGTMNPIGIVGGLFHMVNNSIYKSCLFLCAGAVERKTGTNDLGSLGGLGRSMPFTFVACLTAALAISGVPPFNGFVSKWLVYQGIIGTGSRYGFVFLMAAMFGSALTLASFIKVIYSVFLGPRTEKTAGVKKEVGFTMFIPMVVLAILCLILGIFYQIPIPFLNPMRESIAPIGIWDSTLATVLILVGLVVGFLIFLMGKLLKSARVVKPFIGGETLEMGSDRVSGTHFYDTIKDLPLLKKIYSAQEKGFLDPYNWFGGAGLAVTGLLKKVHNGLLPFYLSWTLLGSVVLLIIFTVLA